MTERPPILSVTGAHSGCGKTFIAETIIRGIPIKWGAIKYTRTALYASLSDDEAVILQDGKDTARLKTAGAHRVFWIQAPPEELDELLGIAMARLADVQGIIIEGNSPVHCVDPDIMVFVFGDDSRNIKESAKPLIEKGNYLIINDQPSIKTAKKMYNKYSGAELGEMVRDIMKTLSLKGA